MTLMGIKTKAIRLELEPWRKFSHLDRCGVITIQCDFQGYGGGREWTQSGESGGRYTSPLHLPFDLHPVLPIG